MFDTGNSSCDPEGVRIEGWALVHAAWAFLTAVFDHAAPATAAWGLHQKSLVLLALLDAGDTPQALARLLHAPPSTLSHMLRELEQRGLIERSLDVADKRRFRLRRTPEGDRALKTGVEAINRAVGERLVCLDPEEKAVVERALQLLPKLGMPGLPPTEKEK